MYLPRTKLWLQLAEVAEALADDPGATKQVLKEMRELIEAEDGKDAALLALVKDARTKLAGSSPKRFEQLVQVLHEGARGSEECKSFVDEFADLLS